MGTWRRGQGTGGTASYKNLDCPPTLQSTTENFPVGAPLLLNTSDSLAPILETKDSLYSEEFRTPWGKRY